MGREPSAWPAAGLAVRAASQGRPPPKEEKGSHSGTFLPPLPSGVQRQALNQPDEMVCSGNSPKGR